MRKSSLPSCLPALLAMALLSACRPGASVPAATAPSAEASAAPHRADRLRVMDWDGYDVPAFFAEFSIAHPSVTVERQEFAGDLAALEAFKAGQIADLVHPCANFFTRWVDAGLLQPVNPALLSHWQDLDPRLVALGRFGGRQYFVPWEWGYDSILVRSDKVAQLPDSWADLWDPAYEGRVTMSDFPEYNHAAAALALGIEDPWDTTEDQNEAISDKLQALVPNLRSLWTSGAEVAEQLAAGEIWLAGNAWPDAYATLRRQGVPVDYIHPKEGRLSWVCGYGISAKAQDPLLAHAYIDAMISRQGMAAAIDELAYGAANPAALPLADQETVALLELDKPELIEQAVFYQPLSGIQLKGMSEAWNRAKATLRKGASASTPGQGISTQAAPLETSTADAPQDDTGVPSEALDNAPQPSETP